MLLWDILSYHISCLSFDLWHVEISYLSDLWHVVPTWSIWSSSILSHFPYLTVGSLVKSPYLIQDPVHLNKSWYLVNFRDFIGSRSMSTLLILLDTYSFLQDITIQHFFILIQFLNILLQVHESTTFLPYPWFSYMLPPWWYIGTYIISIYFHGFASIWGYRTSSIPSILCHVHHLHDILILSWFSTSYHRFVGLRVYKPSSHTLNYFSCSSPPQCIMT
jgi:hypothetical protein